jgi:hypothetical protein
MGWPRQLRGRPGRRRLRESVSDRAARRGRRDLNFDGTTTLPSCHRVCVLEHSHQTDQHGTRLADHILRGRPPAGKEILCSRYSTTAENWPHVDISRSRLRSEWQKPELIPLMPLPIQQIAGGRRRGADGSRGYAAAVDTEGTD